MNSLEPPDSHHLQAVQGWLELGNYQEASEELAKISPDQQHHPDVLEAGWHVCAAAKRWEASIEIANTLIQVQSERPLGWIHRSYSLHELKRTQEAYDKLLPVVNLFPEEYVIPYNLACYSCQLGKMDEASQWLEKAAQTGDPAQVKMMALADPDLAPLRKS